MINGVITSANSVFPLLGVMSFSLVFLYGLVITDLFYFNWSTLSHITTNVILETSETTLT